jgi:hypothetical protein
VPSIALWSVVEDREWGAKTGPGRASLPILFCRDPTSASAVECPGHDFVLLDLGEQFVAIRARRKSALGTAVSECKDQCCRENIGQS